MDHASAQQQVANFEDQGQAPVPFEKMTISEDEYLAFNMNLQYHVKVNIEGQKFNEEIAERIALREWEFDRRGKEEMDRRNFMLCVFQMADAWAKQITAGKAFVCSWRARCQ